MGETPYFAEFIISKCGPLPYPERFAKGGKQGKPRKSFSTSEQERISQLSKVYDACHGRAYDDLAGRALERFAKTFEPIYGKEVAETHKRRREAERALRCQQESDPLQWLRCFAPQDK